MAFEIIKPCSENWDKMNPVQGGRFCDHCSKKVFDLTNGQTPPSSITNFCGRIHTSHTRVIDAKRTFWKQNVVRYLVLLVALIFSKQGQAQSKKNTSVTITDIPLKNSSDTIGKKITITGVITEKESKEPVPFATVVAFDKNNDQLGAVTTDLDGKYTLLLNHLTGKYISLKTAYIGYESVLVKDIPLNSLKKEIRIKLSGSDVILGGVGIIYEYKVPLIDHFSSGTTVLQNEFNHSPK